MVYVIAINAYRKPGTSASFFKDHYENKHVPLVRSIAGDTFPLSHKRHYIQRDAQDKAAMMVGDAAQFPVDAFATLTFSDEGAFQSFMGKVTATDAAAKIAQDEEIFLDRGRMAVVVLGDVQETSMHDSGNGSGL